MGSALGICPHGAYSQAGETDNTNEERPRRLVRGLSGQKVSGAHVGVPSP